MCVSQRIFGLIRMSTEVKLGLMGIEEAVEMISHAAGLDAAESPPAIMQVVQQCGSEFVALFNTRSPLRTFQGYRFVCILPARLLLLVEKIGILLR